MHPVEVLLVEDNPGDIDLTRESLATSKLNIDLHSVVDGIEALAFLRRQGRYTEAPKPDLILLDLNLPKRDGREVLSDIKEDPNLQGIPVVVLTSSDAETDVVKTYGLGANCYVKKPVDLSQFQTIVRTIEDFWFTIVRLPSSSI